MIYKAKGKLTHKENGRKTIVILAEFTIVLCN